MPSLPQKERRKLSETAAAWIEEGLARFRAKLPAGLKAKDVREDELAGLLAAYIVLLDAGGLLGNEQAQFRIRTAALLLAQNKLKTDLEIAEGNP